MRRPINAKGRCGPAQERTTTQQAKPDDTAPRADAQPDRRFVVRVTDQRGRTKTWARYETRFAAVASARRLAEFGLQARVEEVAP